MASDYFVHRSACDENGKYTQLASLSCSFHCASAVKTKTAATSIGGRSEDTNRTATDLYLPMPGCLRHMIKSG
jgi:hypothetical protein